MLAKQAKCVRATQIVRIKDSQETNLFFAGFEYFIRILRMFYSNPANVLFVRHIIMFGGIPDVDLT